MGNYTNLSEDYNALLERVHRALRLSVIQSKIQSKHVNSTALKVNVFDYSELVIVNDELTFLDKNGYHYSLYADCDLEDLINILTN